MAWWSLLEKNVAFEYIHVDLGPHKPDWYKAKVSPYGTVPALYDEVHVRRVCACVRLSLSVLPTLCTNDNHLFGFRLGSLSSSSAT